ncbi:MAG: ECF transporter S component [Chloroflexota bacterium]|nr:ECF transporter S component [Chloroflexota bacterium]
MAMEEAPAEVQEEMLQPQRPRRSIWAVGVRQVVYMALGAALYGGLSYLTNFLQLPSVGNVSIRPAIVIPLFFGAVFGPIVGLFTGGIGNFIGDLISGYGVYWNWDLGNGLIGFVAGLALYSTFGSYFGRYHNPRLITFAEVFSVLGVLVGIGFAAYTDIWVSKLNFAGATSEFVPAVISDLIFGLILLPILLVAYNAAVGRRGAVARTDRAA